MYEGTLVLSGPFPAGDPEDTTQSDPAARYIDFTISLLDYIGAVADTEPGYPIDNNAGSATSTYKVRDSKRRCRRCVRRPLRCPSTRR